MCEECPYCKKKGTMISVSDSEKLKSKYNEDDDMQYGCVCSHCQGECCQCV